MSSQSSGPTIVTRDVVVSRGPRTILHGVSLVVAPGRRTALVGPNGVGKSTLLEVLAGRVPIDRGSVSVTPPSATIGLLAQEPDRDERETVRGLLTRRTGVADAQIELDAATGALAASDPGADDRYSTALERWLSLGSADLEARTGEVWDALGLDERLLDQPTATLSGGEAARASLVALELSRFDVYLLDEPTNDLDLDGLARLERWVLDQRAPIVVVSHDRRFMESVVTHVVEIDEFSHEVSEYAGGWTSFLAERERARQHAWERFEEYDTKRAQLAGRSQREREWSQQGRAKVAASGENDKHIRNVTMDQTEQLAGRAARTAKMIERLEVVDKPREPWRLQLELASVTRSGDVVARLTRAEVDRGSFRLGPVDLLVSYGDRIALIGPNGAGKSTLIDLVLGRIEPTAGTSDLGSGVVVGEIEQVRAQLTGAESLLGAFLDATGLTVADARTLLAKFGLVGDHVERATVSLSPGERTRAALALVMANGANLLVLDEPTNHLDLPAIEQLESALETFPGTVVLVSHDRRFLDAFRATRTIEVRDGAVRA